MVDLLCAKYMHGASVFRDEATACELIGMIGSWCGEGGGGICSGPREFCDPLGKCEAHLRAHRGLPLQHVAEGLPLWLFFWLLPVHKLTQGFPKD